MIGAVIGVGGALFLAAIAAAIKTAITAGKVLQELQELRKDVEEIPENMRDKIKLMIKEDIDAHLGKYLHEEKEVTGVRVVPGLGS
jgi:hypothetical protein